MSSRSTPSSSDGFSLLELLIGISISTLVAAAVFALALSSRRLYEADEARVRIDQNLQAGREIVLGDLLNAGERLGRDFPAIEIVDGLAGAPDRLALRRNLLDVVLPVCGDIAAGVDATFKIAEPLGAPPPPGCTPMTDADADGWPDNLQAWRLHRLDQGGAVRAYLFDPLTRTGEFFQYIAEDAALFDVTAAASAQFSYPLANQCRIYMLEERRYELNGELLRIVFNQDSGNTINVLDEMNDFQAVAMFQDGTQQNALGPADPWGDLGSIQISLDSRTQLATRQVQDRWTFEGLPRNVLSR